MKALLIFVILYTTVSSGFCWHFFHNGRSQGGNLGIPKVNGITSEDKNFTRWFTQKLDHFDKANQATWKQRYYVNEEFFDKSNRDVAFLMIGGEGVASDAWMTNGYWTEQGKKHHAILFQLEHRFYGQSHPTKDLSTPNLKYLSTEYALADLAEFVAAMNKEYNLSPKVKWIAFGGSYPGVLAAWARLKYPHVIHGAVSTSAPLNIGVDFEDYYGVVAKDLRDVSEKCYDAVQKGTAQVDALLENQSGQKKLTELFKLCDPLSKSVDKKNDISTFYWSLAVNFAGIAQYNKDNRMSTKGTLIGNTTLDTACDIMTDSSLGDEVTRLAAFNALIMKAYGQPCLGFKFEGTIRFMKDTHLSPDGSARQWMYQTCNEYGNFLTSNKKPQIFGNKFPTNFYVQQCIDIFGHKFNETYLNTVTHRMNTVYGGLDIKVDNVVFVHGSVDPYSALGVTKTRYPGAPAIFIKGTAHCADMYPPLESDPPQLKAARVEIGKHIQSWLNS